MKPLAVLLCTFVLATALHRLFLGSWEVRLAARIALCVMLLFTALGHFVFTRPMSRMLPPFFPFKKEAVLFTGALEIGGALGLLLPPLREETGWLLMVFFLLLLSLNIYAALHRIHYQNETAIGPGPRYLWFRVPFQFFLLAWTYYATIP